MEAIADQINAVLEDIRNIGHEIGALHAEGEVIGAKSTISDDDLKRLITMQATLAIKRRRAEELFDTLDGLADKVLSVQGCDHASG